MNTTWQQHEIYTRTDGSYVILHNGQHYHVPPDMEEFEELWIDVDAFAQSHPMQVMPEPGPAELTLDEARSVKHSEIKTGYDTALVATLTMPEAAPSAAETAAQAALFAVEDSAGLADVLAILNGRRMELEAAVEVAQSVVDVQAVLVSYPV